ncbi:MAG TPA: transcriptional regulator [Gammaproteobacteria bacterium]|nr:transcriptional regulator [Gammaproteobacteria bacterium]
MLEPSSNCELGPCIKLLSGAWTLEIIFFLKNSPLCFGELKRTLGRVSAKVLTARLRELEQRGVIKRSVLSGTPPNVEYKLSEMGQELIPILDLFSEVSHKLKNKYGSTHEGH